MNIKYISALFALVAVIGGGYWLVTHNAASPQAPALTMSVLTGGGITFGYDTKAYGLVSSADDVSARPANLPCADGFGFCLYRLDTSKGVAGMSVSARQDLATQSTCVSTSPAGTSLTATMKEGSGYATSVFSADANSSVYRLWDGSLCHEFVTRIEPESNVAAVAAAEQAQASTDISSMLASVTIAASGTEVGFPK